MTESATGGGTSGIAGEPRETRPATGTATVASAPAGAVREAGQRGQAGFGAVFAVVTAGVCVVNLDLFIVNVAIPSIGRSFGGANLANLSWVLNAYAIVFAALLVPAAVPVAGPVPGSSAVIPPAPPSAVLSLTRHPSGWSWFGKPRQFGKACWFGNPTY